MTEYFRILPIGRVCKQDNTVWLEVFERYKDGLLGLEGFSHILVLYWLHENDSRRKRQVLRVHPRKDPQNPLTGVFATHAPRRPNPIAVSVCKVKSIHGRRIEVDAIDAFDGSPVIDIKCFVPYSIPDTAVRLPGWIKSAAASKEDSGRCNKQNG